jgi:uncharacterized protein YciI
MASDTAGGPAGASAGANPTEPRWVLLYDSADDVLEKVPIHYPAHSARVDEFRKRGELLEVGTLGDAVPEGSLATFSTREAAEAFVEGDPFVLNGVVSQHRILRWNLV